MKEFKVENNGIVVKAKADTIVKRTHFELFENLAQVPPADISTLKKNLLILAAPRSGSTMFAEALNSTGQLGLCDEWFNYEYFAAYLIVNKIELFNLKDYMKWIIQRTMHNGTFCLKWLVGQVDRMKRDFGVDIFSMNFDHCIWIYRRDMLAQAVSLAKALVTDKFRSTEDGNGNDPSQIGALEVTNALAVLQSKYDYFYDAGLVDMVDTQVAYEDICNFDHPVYKDTLQLMGGEPIRPVNTFVKKQRDEMSKEITKCYREYLKNLMELNDAYN